MHTIYFVLRKYERVSQLQRARPSSTRSSHHGWTTRTLSCTAHQTASCTALIEMVQRSAARVVIRIRRGDRRSMTAALQQIHCHWLPVKYRIEYKILVIVFRALRDRTLTYITSLITPYVPGAPCDLQTARC